MVYLLIIFGLLVGVKIGVEFLSCVVIKHTFS
jgi:hypothetical protein